MSKVIVVVPAYNPAQSFVDLVAELVGEFDVLVINDGSKAECAPFFKAAVDAGAELVEHEVNRGKGAALKTAIAHLQNTREEWCAVTADADGQHCPKDIREVARLTAENPDHLVLGVRSFKGMPARSRFGNTFTRVCFALATGSNVSDTQTGLRGFTHLTADRLITAEGDRYEYEMNVLINLRKWHIPFKETTIETIYIDDNASSHFHPIRDSFIVFAQILKHIAASLICTAVDFVLYWLLLTFVDIDAEWLYLPPRIISVILNYQLSRRVVFRAKANWRSTVGYFVLAAVMAVLGAFLVKLLVDYASINEYVVKIPIDVGLFFVNYFVQKYLIFNERVKKDKKNKK